VTLKKRFLIGHIVIAALGAILIPFGGLAEGHLIPTIYTIPITFCAFAAREILKTIPDAEGDKANGVVNITTTYGARTAMRISQAMLVMCLLALPLLRLVWPLNAWYLAGVLIVIYPLTLFFLVRLSRVPDAEYADVKAVLRLSKLLFLLFALVMLIGSL
jgi:4-hydroxybenzoate polyprenyltransferase